MAGRRNFEARVVGEGLFGCKYKHYFHSARVFAPSTATNVAGVVRLKTASRASPVAKVLAVSFCSANALVSQISWTDMHTYHMPHAEADLPQSALVVSFTCALPAEITPRSFRRASSSFSPP